MWEGHASASGQEKKTKKWLLHHDNAPVHTALNTQKFWGCHSLTLNNRRIWHLVTSFYSQNWRWRRFSVLSLRTSCRNHRRRSTASWNLTSKKCSYNEGTSPRTSVSLRTGTTSRVMVVGRPYYESLFIYMTSLEIFQSHFIKCSSEINMLLDLRRFLRSNDPVVSWKYRKLDMNMT